MTCWVNREAGEIKSLFSARQFEGQEGLDSDDPEVVAFLSPPYADSLVNAVKRKKREVRIQAAQLWVGYMVSDINLTNTELNAYKDALKNDWTTTIKPTIDVLATIEAVKDYVPAWSPAP